ncbi:MAG: hypothetical protein CL920_37945 [Deltaproteobacteria bacterium]|nr:hypothetical protein [Deltaproteobacteria bacterium]MBU54516.1 hypothetical protein [Deltaproteobacteria bacterium]|tara:strand:+ start:1551 stop:4118 length:2568 start_codon:yes stop_codon:yes gene_type:complete
MAMYFAVSQWTLLFWTIGGVLLLSWALYIAIAWLQVRNKSSDAVGVLVEALFKVFKQPLAYVSISALLLITLGIVAGSQLSPILFVTISGVTVSALALLAWSQWPKETADSNLFDLLPLPQVEWPSFEDEWDKRAHTWVDSRAYELKSNPPEFTGGMFGGLALEVSRELAAIYNKETMLSVSIKDVLKGVERTAADMKILSNHLPLAGHLTLADIERQIDVAIRKGRWLYISLYLILSVINPGNLIRVAVIFVQKRSPWEHLLIELRGWVYGHYVQRLGYHMTLIYSERQPPPAGSLQHAIATEEKKQFHEMQSQKLGWLGLISTFGFVLYLIWQIANAVWVFGIPAAIIDLFLLGVLGYGILQIRSVERWRAYWDALQPKWPENPPPKTQTDQKARDAMDLVLYRHKDPPNFSDLKEVPGYYGNLTYELWQACFRAYQHPEDKVPLRATRELYLPQGFAGIERFCADLSLWYEGQKTLPRTIRQLEQIGLDLEALYLYLQQAPSKDEAPTEEPTQEKTEESAQEKTEERGFWKRMFSQVGHAVTGFAIGQLHPRVHALLDEELGERLIDIYGGRFPQSAFEPQETHTTNILVLSRETRKTQTFLRALIGPAYSPENEDQSEDEDTWQATREFSAALPGDTTYHFYSQRWHSLDKAQEDPLTHTFQQHAYHGIILLETIDYGARGNVGTFVKNRLLPLLRKGQVGSLFLVLTGVEKLKPMRWEPPYDDYRDEQPEQRKSQRIRNALLAWEEIFKDIHALPFEQLLPVGLPKEQDPWGLDRIQTLLHIKDVLAYIQRDDLQQGTDQTDPSTEENTPKSSDELADIVEEKEEYKKEGSGKDTSEEEQDGVDADQKED